MKKEGFTILEMMAVIAIIAILAGILIPVVSTVRNNAKKVKAKAMISQLAMAIESYKSDMGYYPLLQSGSIYGTTSVASCESLYRSLTSRYLIDGEAFGPYIESKEGQIGDPDGNTILQFVDPWNKNIIVYGDGDADSSTTPPFHNRYTYDIFSRGPDTVTDNDGAFTIGGSPEFSSGNQPDDINNWN